MKFGSPEGGAEGGFEAREALDALLFDEKTLEDFEGFEKEQVLDAATFMLIEQGVELDPQKRQSLRNLIQALTDALASSVPKTSLGFPEAYRVNLGDKAVDLKAVTIVSKGDSRYALHDLGKRMDMQDVRAVQSVLHVISSPDKSIILNVQLYRVQMWDLQHEVRYLRILDRHINSDLRGRGVGNQLLRIVDNIARLTSSKAVFGQLVPEDPSNMDLLQRGHKKNGYEVKERMDGSVVATKDFS